MQDKNCDVEPLRRKRMKWGRNWPCLCGSGMKYKKCCLADINDLDKTDMNETRKSKDKQLMDLVNEYPGAGINMEINNE